MHNTINMKILIIGNGAREHAILDIISQTTKVMEIHYFTSKQNNVLYKKLLGKHIELVCIDSNEVPLKPDHDYREFIRYCDSNKIELVVVGPELHLVNGISDYLIESGIRCFGPSREASLLEGSKLFAKTIMFELKIPTADYHTFTTSEEAFQYFDKEDLKAGSYVIKADGLAGGKGVTLPKTHEEAKKDIALIMDDRCFGEAGDTVIVETKLVGTEVSVFGFCNGKEAFLMPQAQDYKLSRDQTSYSTGANTALNTGGMGSHAPVYTLTEKELEQVLEYMNRVVSNMEYRGILYIGLMKTVDGLFVLEFNCRFGDPETQVVLNLLDTNNCSLADIFVDCCNGDIPTISWRDGYVANVVLSHLDYPNSKLKSENAVGITGFNKIDESIKTYYANVWLDENTNQCKTTGGRILSVVSYADDYYTAINNVYNNINHFELSDNKRYYRMDIGLNHMITYDPDYQTQNQDQNTELNSMLSRLNDDVNVDHAILQRKRRIKIAILGSTNGTSAELLIQQVKANKFGKNMSIDLILSNISGSGILEKAKEYKISSVYLPFKKSSMTRQSYDTMICNLLQTYEIDYVFLIGYMRIITKTFVDAYRNRIFNIHPSLLPRYAGGMNLSVHESVLTANNREYVTGCTLHQVTEKVDGGRIVLQKQVLIDDVINTMANTDTGANLEQNKQLLKTAVQNSESNAIVECVHMLVNGMYSSKITYKDAGVDIEKGNEFVDIIRKSLSNFNSKSESESENIGKFCSITKIPQQVNTHDYELFLATSTDGVGTKIDLANKYDKLYEAGIDLVAMCVNDLICHGAFPSYFLDYIASNKLDLQKNGDFMRGIIEGCKQAECQLIGGETAEMGNVYHLGGMDAAGFTIGFVERDNLLPNPNIFPEDTYVYGFRSNGLHSNGFSLVRKLIKNMDTAEIDWNSLLCETKIYIQDVKRLLEVSRKSDFRVEGIANITGGGFIENIPRILNEHVGVEIDQDWHVDDIFRIIKYKANLSQQEMLKTFNCGIGMVVIIKSEVVITELDAKMRTFGLQRIGKLFAYDSDSDSNMGCEQIKISVDLF
jgi:phosphoribosylamine--glycine ligase/phosphoribosylaminoimidazole synthetase